MGDVNQTVDLYLQDNKFEEGQIIDNIQVENRSMHIDEISINGTHANSIKLDNSNEIKIEITGKVDVDTMIEMEAQLYDEGHILMATYCPCLLHSRGNRYNGKFTINEAIKLPQNVAKGKYYLEFQLTHPNIEYHMTTSRSVEINVRGIDSVVGERLNYKNAGFLIFD